MNIDVIPLISFVIVTTFTPGPNNISSASMGVIYGYRKTLNYMLGIAGGFFLVMIACAYLSSAMLAVLPVAETYLRWVGAAYILWLAKGMLQATYQLTESNEAPGAFRKGMMLQLLNPKVAVYGLTLYSTFLASISHRLGWLSLSAAAFSATAFVSISTWALFGATIKNKLKDERFRRIVNTALSLLLVYTAAELSGFV